MVSALIIENNASDIQFRQVKFFTLFKILVSALIIDAQSMAGYVILFYIIYHSNIT